MSYDFALITTTYNRFTQINKLLQNVSKLLNNSKLNIQYIVSDNGSTDQTDKVITKFIKNNPRLQISYYRHEHNIGATTNIFFLASKVSAPYFWHISDDDIINIKSIDSIVQNLNDNYYPLVICRVNGIQEWESIAQQNKTLEIIKTDPSLSKNCSYLYAGGFLASNIYNKKEWDISLEYSSQLISTEYGHWAALLDIVGRSNFFGLIDFPCILGNINMIGQSTIPVYSVLIKGRIVVWNSIRNVKIKNNLEPYIVKFLIRPFARMLCGKNPILKKRLDIIREFKYLYMLSGLKIFRFSLYFLYALVIPIKLRLQITTR